MGRRNRKNRDSEDEGIDQAELEWMRKRQKTTVTTSNNSDTTSSDINKEPKANDVSKSSTTATTSEEQDKIERMRLKKVKKKARQKEKKMALKQEEAIQHSKRQAEKALHDKQKKDLDKKKKKLKETGSQEYKTLAKGVKYQDLVIGKGMPVGHRKKVRVSYTLRSKSHTSGKIIDSSHNFGFRVGKGEVIKGWDIGLEGMKVGGSRRLIVPPGAGYGNKDVGAGKGGDLYFQIELLHVAP